MVRFIVKSFCLVFLYCSTVALLYGGKAVRNAFKMDEAYRINPGVDTLIVGSSQVACGVVENAALSNEVFCVTSTMIDSAYMHLLELEKRGALAGIKRCIVDISPLQLVSQTTEKQVGYFLKELHMTWRYMDAFNCGTFDILAYCLTHPKKYSDQVVRNNGTPDRRTCFAERPEEQRIVHEKEISEHLLSMDLAARDMMVGSRLLKVYDNIWELLERNSIEPIAIEMPVLSNYHAKYSQSIRATMLQLTEHLKQRGYRCYDFSAVMPDSMLVDGLHLTFKGQETFTVLLFSTLNGGALK